MYQMISRDYLTKRFSNVLSDYFKENGLNIYMSFSDEFSYNTDADIDFKIKYLTGSIINNKISLPVQFVIEVKNQYFDSAIELLNNFATTYNEKKFDVNDNVKVKELYGTPSVISTFEEDGLYDTTIIALDSRLVVYDGGIFTEDISIKINDIELIGVENIVYNATHGADALQLQNEPLTKNLTNSIQVGLQFDINFKKGDPLHLLLLQQAESINNEGLKVVFNNGFFEKEYCMNIAQVNYNVMLGDVMSGTVALRNAMKVGA